MAGKDYYSMVSEKRKKKEEEEKTSPSMDYYSQVGKRRMENEIGFDTFTSDYNSTLDTIRNAKDSWKSSDDMKNTRTSVEAMQKRVDLYNEYKNTYGIEDDNDLSYSLLGAWDELSSLYGQYNDADAYDSAIKKSQMRDTFRVQNEDGSYRGLTYDEVQEKKKEYEEDSDEYKFLDKYTGYTDLNDFNKAIEAEKNAKAPAKPVNIEKNPNFISNQKKYAVNPLMEQAVSNHMVSTTDEDYLNELEKARNVHSLDNAFDLYKDLMNAEDFEETSQYVSTKTDGKLKKMTSQYGLGYGDLTYEYINNVDGIRDEIASKANVYGSDSKNGISSMAKKNYDQLTEDEVKVYNSIYATKGKEEAQKFLDDMEITLGKRAYQTQTAEWEAIADSGFLPSAGINALSVPASLVGGITGGIEMIGDAIAGKDYNPYSYYKNPTNFAYDTREYVGENIAEETPNMELFGQNIPSLLYGVGMSRADSLVGGSVFGGNAMSAILGSSSAQQKAKELTEQGASQEEIMRGAAIAGGAEALGEKFGYYELMKAKGIDSVWKIFKEGIKQAGSEALEESATEVMNILGDIWNRGEDSDFKQTMADYKERGFSDKESFWNTFLEYGGDVVWAGIGGALAGGPAGAIKATSDYGTNKNVGKQIRENDRVGEMTDLFDTMERQGLTPEESESYRLYGEYMQKKDIDQISNAKLGNLYTTSYKEAYNTTKSKNATDTQKTDATNRLLHLNKVAEPKTADEKAREKRVETLNKGEETAVNGESANIQGIRIEDDSTIVLTSRGEAKAEDMTFSSNDAELLSYAEVMGVEKGNLFLSQYDGKTDVSDYHDSFDLAYAYGRAGVGADNVLANKGVLTETQASEIYKTAVTAKANERQTAIDEITKKYSNLTVKKGAFDDSVIDYDGTSTNVNKVNWSTLTPKQREALTFAKAFSKATGVNIRLVKSNVVNGEHKGKNGSYDPRSNTIEIDVFAGRIDAKTAVDAIIPTISHEVTHWMKAKTPKAFANLQEKVMNTLALDDNMSMKDRIEAEMERMQAAHPNQTVTEEDAVDEIVARACEDMLSNSEKARELLDGLTEAEKKSFVSKVKETFDNLIKWVNELLGQYKSESNEAKFLREYQDSLKEAQKLWDEAFAEAVETNQALQTEGKMAESVISEKLDNVQYAERDSEGNKLTPEQIEFFEDSKVRDKDGNLLVMYHGTPNKVFTIFKTGTYFTEHKWYADVYQNPGASSLGYKQKSDNPGTYAVYLNIKKPFDTRNKTEKDIFYNEYYRKWGTGTDLMDSGLPDWLDGMDLQEFLEEQGYDYDGLILDEGGTGGYGEEVVNRGLSYVIFNPGQAKDINNKKPTENVDIRYSDRTDPLTDDDYKKITKHFGTTGNYNVAGYMLADGKLLDFSGKHWGDTTSRTRQVDHRDIQEVIGDESNGVDSMVRMISNGNIRLMPETGGINLAVVPTKNQRTVLRRYIEYFKGEIVVDIDKVGGDTIKSFTYDKGTSTDRVMRDIDNYFRGGYQSELMRFHEQFNDRLSEKTTPTYEELVAKKPIRIVDVRKGIKSDTYANMKAEVIEKARKEGWLDRPHHNEDTNSFIFLTEKAFKHAYSNLTSKSGEDTIRCMGHIYEIIKEAVLLHVSDPKNEFKQEQKVYTFLGAITGAKGTAPVKLTVKAFNFSRMDAVPKNIRNYFEKNGMKERYNSLYDVHALEVIGIEEIKKEPDASAKVNGENPQARGTSDSFEISIAQLLNLVNGDATKYLPKDSSNEQFSGRDSDGNVITKEQIEFFKDSKVRDENGNLKVMYHGTERGGFTVFNKEFSDDGRSFFFTDSAKVAKGYSGTYAEIIAGKKMSVDEMTDIINDSYLWVEYDNGEYRIVRNKYGEFVVEYSNKNYDEFVEYLTEEYGNNEPSGNYKVYLNIKNPLIVNAEGRNWDDLPLKQTKNVNRYNYIYFTKGMDGKYNVEWEDMMNPYGDAESAEMTYAEIKSKFGEYVADGIKSGMRDFDNLVIDKKTKGIVPRTTRQYAYYAENNGYDGVIFEDIYDTAIYAAGSEKYESSTVAIAFGNNQIKSVANTKPTEDEDIRYSDRTITRNEAYQLARQKVASYRDHLEKKAKIESITEKALVLNRWMLKNSKDEHIPEAMKPTIAHLLQAIDFSSKQLLGMRGGERKGQPTRTDISLSQALADIQQMMSKGEVDGEILYELYGADLDADMADLVKSVNLYMRTVGDNEYVLNQMTLDELYKFDKIVGAMKASVAKMNKFHVANTKKAISSVAQEDIQSMGELGQIKLPKSNLMKGVNQMINWGNINPYFAFKRFGDGGKKIFEALQDGWDKFAFNVKKVIDYAEETYSETEVKAWSEEVHEFDVLLPATKEEKADPNFKGNRQTIQMTTAQIMSLYCLQKRDQAKGHISGGGIRITDIETKNDIISQSDGVVLTDKELNKIIGTLTTEQIAVADKLQKFMNEDCAKWGNEISMARFGYKAFGEPNYFPIKSDENVTNDGEVKEKEKSLYRLLNMSFTKALTDKANNRIVVDNIFDVFAQHASEMAKYNALALPVLDAVRWFNYKEKGEKVKTHFKTYSVKQAMEKAFGKDAKHYVNTFLEDLNGAENVGRDSLAKGFFSNAKIAAVGFNLKVAALQPTSYIRASAIIDPKYLAKASDPTKVKRGIEMAEKWCGMALWKSLGFYDTNIQRGVADLIKHDKTWKDKLTEKSMKGAEKMDKITWGCLWNACEEEVKATRKDLAIGSDEYYTAVGKRLREIIYATQVVDSTMTRSQMMRSPDRWDKVLTNFSSEPTLAYNMLMDVFYDWKLTERKYGKSEAFARNKNKMARVAMAYTVTNLVTSLLEAAFQAYRDDDDEEEDLAEYVISFLETFGSNMGITTKIPYVKDLISILQGFSSNRTDTQWMQNLTYAFKDWMKIFNGEGNLYKAVYRTLSTASQLSGIAIGNAMRDLASFWNLTIGNIYPSLKLYK